MISAEYTRLCQGGVWWQVNITVDSITLHHTYRLFVLSNLQLGYGHCIGLMTRIVVTSRSEHAKVVAWRFIHPTIPTGIGYYNQHSRTILGDLDE
jgi:hypothetical protein